MKRILGIVILATSLLAVDYTAMSVDELSNLRGSVPSEDRDVFKSAFQEKMQYLTPEEKIQYSRGEGKGSGQMTQQKLQDGSGSGNMYQGSRGGGSRGMSRR